MNPIPDFSYFAIPGVMESIRRAGAPTSSIILLDNRFDAWDEALVDDYRLQERLHLESGMTHHIFVTYAPNEYFLLSQRQHMQQLIKPAAAGIDQVLSDYGVEDRVEFMALSDHWLNDLFANRESHYEAAKMLAGCFGLRENDLPAILLWSNIDNRQAVTLSLSPAKGTISSRILAVYRAIFAASQESAERIGRVDLNYSFLQQLQRRMQKNFARSGVGDVAPSAISRSGANPVSQVFRDVASEYRQRFSDSLLHYEEEASRLTLAPRKIMPVAEQNRTKIERNLTEAGYAFKRHGGNHDIWVHKITGKSVSVPRHPQTSIGVAYSLNRAMSQ